MNRASLTRLLSSHCTVARLVVCVGICSVASAMGCQKTLFPTDLPRNQFETHDRMRQAYIPLEEPDVFGTPQPALRARLAPK